MRKASFFTIYLCLWIVGLFGTAIVFTFFNDALQASGFFGDVLRSEPSRGSGGSGIDEMYDWGARHYWYFWMCLLLFIVSMIRIFMWGVWYWDRKVFDKEIKK